VWAYSIVYREHEKLSFLDAPPITNILQGEDVFDGVRTLGNKDPLHSKVNAW
jgi:hypothetical protein